ncbi:DUF2213 domain-containing protein [Roseomonas mucosa]
MQRFDFVDLSAATVTPEGWIRDRPILSRTGVFEYRRADGSVRREYRPPGEVFHPDSLASLRGVPVTDDHPGMVTAENDSAVIGAVLTAGQQDGENLVAELVIHRPRAMGSRRELSLGYSLDLDETPGEVGGQRYDAVQRNIRVNHAAVVQRGRAGNARLRLDHDDAASEPVDPVTTAPARRDDATVALRRELEVAEAARDELQRRLNRAAAELAQVRQDTRVRLELEQVAVRYGVAIRADAPDRDLQVAVLRRLCGDAARFDGRSDDYVRARYDTALEDVADREARMRGQRSAVNGRADGGQDHALGQRDRIAAAPAGARAARADMIAHGARLGGR